MNCRRAQPLLSAAMDGVHLSADERRAIEDHVGGCASCTAFERGALQVRTAVRIRAAENVPDLTDRIMATVARGTERPARRPIRSRRPARPRRLLPVIAAAIAGLMVGSLLVGGPWRAHPRTAWASEIELGVRQAAPSIDAFQGSYTSRNVDSHRTSPNARSRWTSRSSRRSASGSTCTTTPSIRRTHGPPRT